jgi:ribonuclease HI
MARGYHGRLKKRWKRKNWKETAKDRRTWRDLAEKVKTHKGL